MIIIIVILFVCLKVILLLLVSSLIQTEQAKYDFSHSFLKINSRLNLTLKNSQRFDHAKTPTV